MKISLLLVCVFVITACTTNSAKLETDAVVTPQNSVSTRAKTATQPKSPEAVAAPSKKQKISLTTPTQLKWADLTGLRPEYQMLMSSMRLAVCEEPRASELPVPIAPKLLLTTAGCVGEKFQCPLAEKPVLIEEDEYFCPPVAQGRELGELSFVSTATVSELAAWYRNQLDEAYLEYRADDLETLFVRDDISGLDALSKSSASTSIEIRFSDGIWSDAGYRSEVIVSRSSF